MSLHLATAPVTWGVWERTVERDDLVPPADLLAAATSLGYGAIELGPPGYLGTDAASVRQTLEPFGVALVGAFVLLHLGDESAFEADLSELERAVAILAEVGSSPVVLLADAGTPGGANSPVGGACTTDMMCQPPEGGFCFTQSLERAGSA